MSFTAQVKNEISKIEVEDIEAITELSAIIRNSGIIDKNIKITTENASVARKIFKTIKQLFDYTSKITVRRGYNFNKNYIYIIEINKSVDKIVRELSIDTNIPKNYIVDDQELKRAYLKGLFLSSGSINDPKTARYHLEFLVDSLEYSEFLINMMNEFRLNAKSIKRDNRYMIYIKEAEKISDFLRIVNAMNALFYFEDIRIYRDHKNMTNRLNNCEQANVDRIIETANNQINDIDVIEKADAINLLDDKIKEVIIYRKKYPEVSLTELAEIISLETGNSITKSGIYHRIKKITELAKKIREKN